MEIERGVNAIEMDIPHMLLKQLGESPIDLTFDVANRVKEIFPIPKEQIVIWAAAEFDLRPSGIALTDKGILIRTDVGVFDGLNKDANNNGKPLLYYYRWEDFDPAWCAGDDGSNIALSVADECSLAFVDACKNTKLMQDQLCWEMLRVDQDTLDSFAKRHDFQHDVEIGAMTPIALEAQFAHTNANEHNPTGHGVMAEKAMHRIDVATGKDAIWKGPDNERNGADRIVDDLEIQTKYHRSAIRSLNSAFDKISGDYKYISQADGSLMKLEVPKDQYDQALRALEGKIRNGELSKYGITDPDKAKDILKRGKLTYKQAVNLTKAGKIESLAYDAATGTVICSCVFGITFVATVYNTYRMTENLDESIKAGIIAGTQVFGVTFIQHILSSQISRTGIADALIAPSQALVQKMGYKATQTVVNGLRALAGKKAISGAAASKQLAKWLRGNAVTAAVTMAVFSVPEIHKLANNKISGSQFAKNMGALTGSVAGGAAGAIAAGAAASKIAAAAGTAVAPGVGTAVGMVGGFVGGAAGTIAVKTVGGIFIEDDIEMSGRLLNAMISVLAYEYMLSEDEISLLAEKLNKIDSKKLSDFFENLRNAENQEESIRELLSPLFDEVVENRDSFSLPTGIEITATINELADEK